MVRGYVRALGFWLGFGLGFVSRSVILYRIIWCDVDLIVLSNVRHTFFFYVF